MDSSTEAYRKRIDPILKDYTDMLHECEKAFEESPLGLEIWEDGLGYSGNYDKYNSLNKEIVEFIDEIVKELILKGRLQEGFELLVYIEDSLDQNYECFDIEEALETINNAIEETGLKSIEKVYSEADEKAQDQFIDFLIRILEEREAKEKETASTYQIDWPSIRAEELLKSLPYE